MNPQQLFAEVNRRNIGNLHAACAAAALLLIVAAAVLLATLEWSSRKMKALVRTLASGKVYASVRRVDRSTRYAGYEAHSYRRRA